MKHKGWSRRQSRVGISIRGVKRRRLFLAPSKQFQDNVRLWDNVDWIKRRIGFGFSTKGVRSKAIHFFFFMNLLQQHDIELLDLKTSHLIGIDEAGRGSLAGPVVAGACVIAKEFFENASAIERSALINDSKRLSAEAREAQFAVLVELQAEGLLNFEVAEGSVEEIAEFNILGANRLAMERAVNLLAKRSSWTPPLLTSEGPLFGVGSCVKLIVDGRPLKPFPYIHEGIVKGDGKSLSIAMASIVAKVTRDRKMLELAGKYPQYGLKQHKGYATKAHRQAILEHGPSRIHRNLFLRKLLAHAEGD